ncbi:hypothetical protein HDU92_005516, partial [Lobulomyces angularis]
EYNAKPTSTPCLQPTSTALPENYEKPTKAYETATPKAAEEKKYKATAPEATTYASAAGKADYSASNLESSSSKMTASLFAAVAFTIEKRRKSTNAGNSNCGYNYASCVETDTTSETSTSTSSGSVSTSTDTSATSIDTSATSTETSVTSTESSATLTETSTITTDVSATVTFTSIDTTTTTIDSSTTSTETSVPTSSTDNIDLSIWLLQVPATSFKTWVYPPQVVGLESYKGTSSYTVYSNDGKKLTFTNDQRDIVGVSGGKASRSEFREYTSGNDQEQALWNLGVGEHIFKGVESIDQVASGCTKGGAVVAGQVKGKGSSPDIMSIRYYADNFPGGYNGGETGKTNGGKPFMQGLNLVLNGYEGKFTPIILDINYKLKTKFNFQFRFFGGRVYFTFSYEDGSNSIAMDFPTNKLNNQEAYFKVGAYSQNSPDTVCLYNQINQVSVYDLSVTHK